ncbi:MAG: ATPase AAA [Candidatus Micrarchaeota archaeon]|nr:MAG: ATPase AAA [Candidatus Micrarchaeota archaeon]
MTQIYIFLCHIDINARRSGTNNIKRKIYTDKIVRLLKSSKIIAEIGIRRSGKSYIAKQVIKELIDNGLDKYSTLIINLNDERLQKEEDILNDIYNVYRKNIKKEGIAYIIIDEAQEIEGWERFVRGLTERNEARFILTGSSSKLLSSEYNTLLSGRHISIEITPLSFYEFLIFKGLDIKDKLDLASKHIEIQRYLEEYMLYGGFPDVVLNDSKIELLNSYFDTIIVKDVILRYNIRNPEKLRAIARYYLTNIGNPITYNRLARFTKIPLKTIERYTNYIESSFSIFLVKRFSTSLKEQENSPRKVYSIDNGLAIVNGFNMLDRGRLLENLVAIELKRRGKEFYYWTDTLTKKEVDFVVVNNDRSLDIIQVSYSINDPLTYEREVSAIETISKRLRLNIKNRYIIVKELPNNEIIKDLYNKGIKIIDIVSFLLGYYIKS